MERSIVEEDVEEAEEDEVVEAEELDEDEETEEVEEDELGEVDEELTALPTKNGLQKGVDAVSRQSVITGYVSLPSI